ncbi:hypothetical protein N801_09895 [Knoellia aerolata DSM 18566]|uniref:DUF3105 domain-containing protein n=1 Tax=Knoellia aerolata DSM 18566 TaxID=1385519 RepID=A0A0A0JUF0_9MICO|nr:hypothetical protein N801_09895 [Knoellia aerolata DSM 18566]
MSAMDTLEGCAAHQDWPFTLGVSPKGRWRASLSKEIGVSLTDGGKQARPGRQKLLDLRQQQARRERRQRLMLWGAAVSSVMLVVGVVATALILDQRNTPSLGAVQTFTPEAGHTEKPVTYEQSPPAGGEHAPVWLNCGMYDAPVVDENAVHSMEHGAVWITYSPDLPAAQVEKLRESVPDTYMVLSPYEGLPSPLVASAWGKQLHLSGADDARLTEFVREFRQGKQAPEPGAPCTGGVDGGPTS